MPKRVTSGGVHLGGLAPGLHSSEERSQRRLTVGDIVTDLTEPGIKPMSSCVENDVFTYNVNQTALSVCNRENSHVAKRYDFDFY